MEIAFQYQLVGASGGASIPHRMRGPPMPRSQEDPRHPLITEEQAALERLGRAHPEPATCVARAKALLAVSRRSS